MKSNETLAITTAALPKEKFNKYKITLAKIGRNPKVITISHRIRTSVVK
jgi:hypothetical protein